MKVIGITGGIGSGKSKVLEFLKTDFQAVVSQADLVAHRLFEPGECCYNQIVSSFGSRILREDGTIDREVLGGLVFSDSEKRRVLNEIVHPLVKQRICQEIEEQRQIGTRLFILEAALLIEDHYDMICDELWYIYADEKTRRERLKTARGYSDDKINYIFESQSTEEFYRTYCKYTIDNSGVFEDTIKQIRDLEVYMEELAKNRK